MNLFIFKIAVGCIFFFLAGFTAAVCLFWPRIARGNPGPARIDIEA